MRVHKAIAGAAVTGLVSVFLSATAAAHVVVQPAEVQTAKFQTFTVGVPNERDSAVTKLELKVPGGLQFVSPTVHTGWEINTVKSGSGEEAVVTDIMWSGGSIPSGQRDEFTFSAKVPAKAAELQWKAYQTYEDGMVVSWDQKPSSAESDDDSATKGPYSVTDVVAELAGDADASRAQQDAATAKADATHAKTIAYAGVALGLLGIFLGTRKPQQPKE